MIIVSRRRLLAGVFPVAATLAAVQQTASGSAERLIKITAQRFRFSPNRINFRQGDIAVLELTSLDRIHGFYIPELDVQSDITPGITTRISLSLEKPGEYDFLCDLFCGAGHGEMVGKIVVSA